MIMSFCSLCSDVLLFVAAEWWLFHCVSFSLFLSFLWSDSIKASVSMHFSLCVLNYNAMSVCSKPNICIYIIHVHECMNVCIHLAVGECCCSTKISWIFNWNTTLPWSKNSMGAWGLMIFQSNTKLMVQVFSIIPSQLKK